MSQNITVVTQSMVSVIITSSVNTFGSERRFQKNMTIADLKGKLELLTGSSAGNMKLEVYNKDNELICKLHNEEALLGSYPVDDGMRIHVVDPTLKLGEFEDLSKVKKLELSDEDYTKRTDSVRAFKEKNKLGRFQEVDPEEKKRLEEEKLQKKKQEQEKAESMKVGDRCEVRVPGQPVKRGVVKYIGTTEFKPGYWVGVQYDEPLGKNDGSVNGKRYFDCPEKYGGFVKPEQVETGNFPEEDYGFNEDEI
ncbi:hypothetical protein CHS0354_014587 [Potamilus streckersoni]|uniref:CAP-Gly domain-containing protein n=1 Tax=Potamilus streckersoni TaxID=2493646 RepID=A0AAE0RNF8_9BIVA|nr:hypothetical protein CHS0354_014587 [Potamilus streckersoni]